MEPAIKLVGALGCSATVRRSERIRWVRASLKGKAYLRGDVTRHHLHSTTKTTKGDRSPESPAPTQALRSILDIETTQTRHPYSLTSQTSHARYGFLCRL